MLEEGISTVREIDLGIDGRRRSRPAARALPALLEGNLEGLDTLLERMDATRSRTASTSRRPGS